MVISMKKAFCLLLAVIMTTGALGFSVSALEARHYEMAAFKVPEGKHTGFYKENGILYKYSEDGGYIGKLSGWTTLKNGNRNYYINGVMCKGWRKIKGKWHYFDDKGAMMSGIAHINDKKYIFEDDGAWSGRMTKADAYPGDFSVNFSYSDGLTDISFNMPENFLTVDFLSNGSRFMMALNMSEADTQVFYSMASDMGLSEFKREVNADNMAAGESLKEPFYDETGKGDLGAPSGDMGNINITIASNGKKYSLTGDSTAFSYADENEEAADFCQFAWFVLDYIDGLDIPQDIDNGNDKKTLISAPYINQVRFYPTGCESVSAVMALRYAGINISPVEFIDKYLDMGEAPIEGPDGKLYGCDPWEAFPGDPYSSEGFGCYAPVIVNALNKSIDSDKYAVNALYGRSLGELCSKYIDNGVPVILWATMEMKQAAWGKKWSVQETGRRIDWIVPMHCLLLVGYDDNYYYFNDPQTSKMQAYEKQATEAAYAAMYSQAVAVTRAVN